jgi:ankyrin repeat protein
MKKCPSCAEKLPHGALQCSHCGEYPADSLHEPFPEKTGDSSCSDIFEAIKAGEFGAARDILRKNPSLVNAEDDDGRAPLHWASEIGDKEAAKFLLSKGADVNARDQYGTTPLHDAASKGHREMAELLISQGANVNAQDMNGWFPLHRVKTIDVAELLISRGADVNARDQYGNTPLHNAASAGILDVADALIASGAMVNAKANNGWRPLYVAKTEEMKELLRSHGGKE